MSKEDIKSNYKSTYTAQYNSLQELIQINKALSLYLKQNPVGQSLHDVFENDTTTNDRKTFYKNQSYETLQYWFWVFLAIYGVIGIVALYLLYNTKYSQYVKVFVGLLIICYPISIYFIIGKILSAIYSGYNMLPTNVNFSP